MTEIPRWRRYLRLAKPNVSADVDDELAFHIDMRIADNMRRGMRPDDARREALEKFGDVPSIRTALVDHDRQVESNERRREFLGDFLQDVRFGARSLRRAPGFAAAAILTLALGIGANTAIFSIVDALLLRPLPFAQPGELVSIGAASGGEFLALSERLHSFSYVAGYGARRFSIDDGKDVARLEGAAVTPNLFRTLGVSAEIGSTFDADASVIGKNFVIILSHGYWQRQFGGSRNAIGSRLIVDGTPHTVIGVMPADFHYPSSTSEYWLPLTFNRENIGALWGGGAGQMIARVKPGVPTNAALQEVRDVWPTLRRLNPLWDPGEQYGRNANPQSLQETMVGAPRSLLWTLIGCVMLVLLIACVNVANLLLARATSRQRELAVRAAVGGGRARLIRQLVTESLMLSIVGATLGVLLALGTVKWLVSILPPGIPRVDEISVNGTVLVATAAIAIVTGLLFGILPAARATASTRGPGLMGGRRSTEGPRHHRISGLLVAGEVALAVLLVIGSLLLVRSFRELRRVEPGFQATHLVAARITPPGTSYSDPDRVIAFYADVLDRIAALPGVQRTGAVDKLPIATNVWGIAPRIEGLFEDATKSLPDVHHFQAVTPGYFATMGISVAQGRGFDDNDGPTATPVALVSQSMARHFWPNESPIGKRVGYPWPSPWITIVGVVADVKQDSLRDTLTMSLYVPWEQRTRMSGNEMWVLARTSGDAGGLGAAIRGIVKAADRTVPVSSVRTMEEVIDGSVQRDRFTMIIVGLFAVAALLLGAVGIYGVMSYLVSQRTQEMGVRMALGASQASVLRMVVARGAIMAGAGAIIGVIGAFWATRPLAGLLYGVSPTDPLTFIMVPLLFLAVAIAASAIPARRATRVDPVRALRAD